MKAAQPTLAPAREFFGVKRPHPAARQWLATILHEDGSTHTATFFASKHQTAIKLALKCWPTSLQITIKPQDNGGPNV